MLLGARPSCQHKRKLFALVRQKAGNNKVKDRGQGRRRREQGEGGKVFASEDKGLPLAREEMYVAHSKMSVYKGEMKNLC